GLRWSLLMAVVGPMLIAFAVALLFAPIQLEVLDLFPHERGAAASMGTFFGLVLNALLAGVIAPLVTANLVTLAATSLAFAVLGGGMWGWHLYAVRRPARQHCGARPSRRHHRLGRPRRLSTGPRRARSGGNGPPARPEGPVASPPFGRWSKKPVFPMVRSMKRLLDTALVYMVLGLASGLFYRE